MRISGRDRKWKRDGKGELGRKGIAHNALRRRRKFRVRGRKMEEKRGRD